jgi:NAD(P)-dependent dehydrogenase (short-subunit alcohol dehydrogenase family)
VPGVFATVGAIGMAMVKMRQGNSTSFNKWLRFRVVAQGLTVVAICAGTATFSTHKKPTSEDYAAIAAEKAKAERAEFEERMRAAEEAERAEAALRSAIPRPASKPKTYADKQKMRASSAPAQETPLVQENANADGATGGWWPSQWFGSKTGSKEKDGS